MSTEAKSTDWATEARKSLGVNPTLPLGHYGHLEFIAIKLAQIQQTLRPTVASKRLCLFAASHGIATAELTVGEPAGEKLQKLIEGQSNINLLSQLSKIELYLINLGTDPEIAPSQRPDFFHLPLAKSTQNFLEAPAMSAEQCSRAMEIGRAQARLAKQENIELLGIGEVSLGNNVSASTLYAALMGIPPKIAVGRGLETTEDHHLKREIEIVTQALKKYSHLKDPQEWLAAVGGFEIAAMTGLILESTSMGIPVVVDSFVATSAALVARRLSACALDHCLFAQQAAQPSHATVLPLLDSLPILHLKLKAGEGLGALLAMPIIEAAAKLLAASTCE